MSDSVSKGPSTPADKSFQPDEFFAESYGARQFVTFVPDTEWRTESTKEQTDKGSLSKYRPSLGWSGFPVRTAIVILAGEITKRIKEAWEHDIPIMPLPFSAASEMNLKPGHPRQNLLYAAHPCDSKTYVPSADFHRLTFEHKFSELLQLLMHLGATTIDVEHVHGWERDFASRLSGGGGVPQAEVEASSEAEVESSTKERLLYHAELDGSGDPALPDDLVWHPHEPTWQSVAKGALKFGLEGFSLNLQYTDDYGINAELKANAEDAGFDLGGSFENHESTTWSVEGTFRA